MLCSWILAEVFRKIKQEESTMEVKSDRDFIATLREHGLQVTYQRLAIYQAVFNNTKEHLSADLIYQSVRKRFPMISLGTVYKTLERFYEVGLIHKVSPITEVARYDAELDSHHHFVCIKCQAIKNAGDVLAQQQLSVPETHGFHLLRSQIVFQGYCPNCKPRNLS
jgi:Fur family transcriptional regulator, peroxide stress response regulator